MQSNESLGVLRLIFPSSRAGRRPVIGWKHLGGPWPLSDFYRELSSGCITDWKGSDTTWELRMGASIECFYSHEGPVISQCHTGCFVGSKVMCSEIIWYLRFFCTKQRLHMKFVFLIKTGMAVIMHMETINWTLFGKITDIFHFNYRVFYLIFMTLLSIATTLLLLLCSVRQHSKQQIYKHPWLITSLFIMHELELEERLSVEITGCDRIIYRFTYHDADRHLMTIVLCSWLG